MRPSVHVPAVPESGIGSNRLSVQDSLVNEFQHLRIRGLVLVDVEAYIIILRYAVHVSLCDSVQYHPVVPGREDDFRYGIVRFYDLFDASQLQLQPEVPVY